MINHGRSPYHPSLSFAVDLNPHPTPENYVVPCLALRSPTVYIIVGGPPISFNSLLNVTRPSGLNFSIGNGLRTKLPAIS